MSVKQKLQAWHKTEYLTPHQVEHDSDTILLDSDEDLPWLYPGKYNLVETEKHTFRHQVLFGVFDVEEMMRVVRKVFHDNDISNQFSDYKVKSVFAEITVEHIGSYKQGSFKVSTVPFALGKLEREGPGRYEAWHQSFRELELELQSIVFNKLQDTVNLDTLNQLLDTFTEKVQWSPRFRKCRFWAKSKQILKPKSNESSEDRQEEEAEMPGILNSFYLREIESILQFVEEAKEPLGKGLTDYLTSERRLDNERTDVDSDREELTRILSPKNIPLGKWPGNDKHTLNLMQQAAVNQIFMNLSDKPGLFSVNGPPGTGKTTLLRDVIASIVVERARKLLEFKTPAHAFSLLKSIGDSRINSLDDRLRGYGIIISSSNNGAVENISKELPEISSIDTKYRNHEGASYFREVAQTVSGPNNWGLISAALGRSSNRFQFFSKFWYKPKDDPGTSFKELLLQTKELKKGKTESEILKDWAQARESFNSVLQDVLKEQQAAIQLYSYVLKSKGIQQRVRQLTKKIDDLKDNLAVEQGQMNEVSDELQHIRRQHNSIIQQIGYLNGIKFGLWGILFRWKEYLDVRKTKNKLLMNCSELQNSMYQLEERELQYQKKIHEFNRRINEFQKKTKKWQARASVIQQKLDHEKTENKRVVMDDEYWEQSAAKIQKSSPWITLRYTEARSRLFLEALKLHESFIMAAQSKIIGNLFVISKPSSIDYHADKDILPALWDVFTLIVPVVSSTFASISSMFKGMGAQSLGWLFIDEAGQATPQAAVGAIWRTQRTVVVGDPLQIEPVVTLPKAVIQDISRYYDVDHRYISINSSVQTVADLANKSGTFIRDKWIGSPLWVHRRCISPMFDICNEIAYDGRMVLDTLAPNEQAVANVELLGPNDWIHVEGESTVKQYVPQQAEAVFKIIWRAFEPLRRGSSSELPSLFVISPFAAVKQQLKTMLKDSHRQIADSLSKKEYHRWIHQSVGTVHTFQGKQADSVIFCLGVDIKNSGAADWATSSVNLINVAVSRAKYRFIVVGDKRIWASKEFMSTVHQYIVS